MIPIENVQWICPTKLYFVQPYTEMEKMPCDYMTDPFWALQKQLSAASSAKITNPNSTTNQAPLEALNTCKTSDNFLLHSFITWNWWAVNKESWLGLYIMVSNGILGMVCVSNETYRELPNMSHLLKLLSNCYGSQFKLVWLCIWNSFVCH